MMNSLFYHEHDQYMFIFILISYRTKKISQKVIHKLELKEFNLYVFARQQKVVTQILCMYVSILSVSLLISKLEHMYSCKATD